MQAHGERHGSAARDRDHRQVQIPPPAGDPGISPGYSHVLRIFSSQLWLSWWRQRIFLEANKKAFPLGKAEVE